MQQNGENVATIENLSSINNELLKLKKEKLNTLINIHNNTTINGTNPVSIGSVTVETNNKPIICIVSLCASVNTAQGFIYLFIDGNKYVTNNEFLNFDNASNNSFKIGSIIVKDLPKGIHTFDIRGCCQKSDATLSIKQYNRAVCTLFEV